MTRLDNILSLVLCVSFLAALSAPTKTSAADPGPAAGINVHVVNTPLPVQGTVNVGNFPASSTVSGSVSITGTPDVKVTNTASAPVLTRDVDNPALQPFQNVRVISTPAGLLGGDETFTVPAGKRLVIEFVSFQGSWPAGQATTRLFIGVCNSGGGACQTRFFFPAVPQGPDFGGDSLFTASSPTRLYADPGTDVTVSVRRNAAAGTGLASVEGSTPTRA
jgi:hypothetical protein